MSEDVYSLVGKVDSFSCGKEADLTVTFRDPELLEGLLGSKVSDGRGVSGRSPGVVGQAHQHTAGVVAASCRLR